MSHPQDLPDWSGDAVVVDARPHDYIAMARHAEERNLRLSFLADGRSALHCFATYSTALWLVNLELPDFSGLELLEMLVTECPEATVLAIANAYDSDEEIRALNLGAAMYLCKPPHPSWLVGWQQATTPLELNSKPLDMEGRLR